MSGLRTVVVLILITGTCQAGTKPKCAAIPKRLVTGLTFQTALEKPVQRFTYRGAAAKRFMARVRRTVSTLPWRTFDEEVEYILDPSGDTHFEGDNNNASQQSRFKAVLDYMRDNLTGLQTAFFGKEPAYHVYVFGRDRCGNIVGFRVVEVT